MPMSVSESLPTTSGVFTHTWKRNSCRQQLAMTANGWSNMVEEELLPPTAGMTAKRGLLPMMISYA